MIAGVQIRPIAQADNKAMATIIRTALTEFGANKPGTVFYDDTTDHLFELFQSAPLSAYYVAEKKWRIDRWCRHIPHRRPACEYL